MSADPSVSFSVTSVNIMFLQNDTVVLHKPQYKRFVASPIANLSYKFVFVAWKVRLSTADAM